ncbi:CBS domain-containing protein [Sinorhizobium meliloti]|nr:CBS domain-containing protein [Sinorhizobium meliloti]MDW9986475.1 CBS domain-containing protein [Sinorhizobium meliloti]
MIARDVMTVDVVTVSPDHSVSHAAQIMLDHHISGLPVLDDQGHLVGIVTEGDFLRRSELGLPALSPDDQHLSTNGERARSYVKSHSWKVADVMTANLVQVDEGASLTQIAALMEERGIKRVPVMRGDNLVGIVSRADLLHALITAKLDDTAPGDYAIRRSILTRLKENSDVTGVNLTITVTDGMVHLWGVVNSESERDLSRVVAEGVRGVNGVYDHLTLSDRV